MYETDDDLQRLRTLLKESADDMGDYMRSILTPERTLSASQIVTYLQGVKQVALATVTARGEPRVAPLDALFIRGRFHAGTAGAAIRLRHLRARPPVSLTHLDGDDVGISVHGRATLISRDHPEAPELERIWRDVYGWSAYEIAEEVVLIRVEPWRMYAYASHPERFPEEAPP